MMQTLYDEVNKELPSYASSLPNQSQMLSEFDELLRQTEEKSPDHFNNDQNYRQAINEVLDLKAGIEKKCRLLSDRKCFKDDKLRQRIMNASSHDFSDDGFIYVLRSGTVEVPWLAIMQGLDYLALPERLTFDEYTVMWECIREHGDSMTAVKIENLEGKPVEIPIQNILKDSTCSLSNLLLGSKITALVPGLMMNQNLKCLDISGNQLGDEGAQALPPVILSLTTLQTLKLRANSLGSSSAKLLSQALSRSSGLTALTLSLNPLGDEGLVSIGAALKHHTNLQTLDLSWTLFGDRGLTAVADTLQVLGTLTSFEIHGETGYLSPEALQQLALAYKANPKLRHTLFHLPRPEECQAEVVSSLASLQNLDILQLAGSCRSYVDSELAAEVLGNNKGIRIMANGWEMVSKKAMKKLREAQEGKPKLEKLMLFECRLEEGAFDEIARLVNHHECRLTHLDIFGLDKDGANINQFWGDVIFPSTLETLRIVASGVADEATKGLCFALARCRSLSNLNLSKNRIGGSGITEIAKSVASFSLRELDLSDNMTGDEMVRQLARPLTFCDNIEKLDLSSNQITLTGALQLRHFLRTSRSMTTLNLSNNRLHMHSDEAETLPNEAFDGLLTLCQVCHNLKHVDLERNGLSPKLTEMFMKFVHTLQSEFAHDLEVQQELAGPPCNKCNPMYWVY